jgi:hypothetical protein
MDESNTGQWTAFAGSRRIASGALPAVALAAKAIIDAGEQTPVLVFNAASHVVDIDYRGSDAEVVARLTHPAKAANADEASPYLESLTPRGRGRPKLGVVAREVTLLPRHWDWLATQPGGASAAVRRLVDEARQSRAAKDDFRQATESAYRFMSAMAGNEPGFEEATRALFARNDARFTEMTEHWPRDVRDHARTLAARAFA